MKRVSKPVLLLFLLLIGVGAFAQETPAKKKATSPKTVQTVQTVPGTITLKLSGLHCQGCAGSIRSTLMAVPGVKEATVDPKSQQAVVTVSKGQKPPTNEALKAAVTKAGKTYKVLSITRH